MTQIDIFTLYFDILLLISIIALSALCLADRRVIKIFSGIRKRTWIYLALIFFMGLFFRLELAPNESSGYIWEYAAVGKSILTGTNDTMGGPHTIGYPLVLSIFFLLFGSGVKTIYLAGIFFGGLSVVAMFFLSYAFFRDDFAALLGALILASRPWHIYLSSMSEVEIVATFFLVGAVAVLRMSISSKIKELLILGYFMLLFAVQVKREFIVMIVFLALYNLFHHRKNIMIILERHFHYFLILFLFAYPVIFDLKNVLKLNSKYNYLSMEAASSNLPGLSFYLIEYISIPMAVLTLIVVVSLWLRKIRRDNLSFFVIWLFILFLVYMPHKNGIYMRYLIFFDVPLIVLLSYGLSFFLKRYSYDRAFVALLCVAFTMPLIYSYNVCGGEFEDCILFESSSEYRGQRIAYAVHMNVLDEYRGPKALIVAEDELKYVFRVLYPDDRVLVLDHFLNDYPSKDEMKRFFSKNNVFFLDYRCSSFDKAPFVVNSGYVCDDIIDLSTDIVYSIEGVNVYALSTDYEVS